MISRLRQYWFNLGPLQASLNLLVIGFLMWRLLKLATTPFGMMMLGVSLVCFLAPLAIVGWLGRRWSIVGRVLSVFFLAMLALIVLSITRTWSPPPLAWIGIVPVLMLALGAEFWCLSDRRFFTVRGLAAHQRRAGDAA